MLKIIILQVSVFFGLLIILWLAFHGQLNNALRSLNGSLKSSLKKEEELKEKKSEIEEAREAEINKGKKEAKEILETAKKEASHYKENLQEEAKREKELLIQKGQQEVEKIKRGVELEVQNRATALATEIIEQLFNGKSQAILHQEIINEAIKELETINKERFLVKPDKIKITSALALEDGDKNKIKKILAEKIDNQIQLEENIDTSLIAGFILHIDSMIIDASLKNRLKKIIPLLKK
jgi:F0F1-type ATP synthase membrane subunit b/b'